MTFDIGVVMKLNEWVTKNCRTEEKKNYSKGWWNYIEFIRKIESKTNAKIEVFSEYEIMTPPPSEFLKLPLIKLSYSDADIYIKEDFSNGGFLDCWMVSVVSKNELNNIRKHINDIKTKQELKEMGFLDKVYSKQIEVFKKENLLFDSYNENKKKFTFTVEDEYDLYTAINIIIKN
mgnify:CR=1 FL=1|tara:strand:- start:694 stop:1221 length:528 start_codon:yes stop_codon:yes gene_type:complete